jgi:hypothetical protein
MVSMLASDGERLRLTEKTIPDFTDIRAKQRAFGLCRQQ